MADINYFTEPKSWKVITGSGQFTKYLPAKGSSIKIELKPNGASKSVRFVPAGRSRIKPCEGFKFLKGRLELPIQGADYVLVIEENQVDGKPGLKAKFERRGSGKGIKKDTGKEMSGTWGAETNPPGGTKYGDAA